LVQYANGQFLDVDVSTSAVPVADKAFRRVVSASDGVWALATDGTTLFVTGGRATYERPAVTELLSLDVLAGGFGWAGGQSVTAGFVGAVDDVWSQAQDLPAGVTVGALDLVSTDYGWAVGQEPGDPPQARVWRWDGTRWQDGFIDKTWEISDVQMLDRDEGWAGHGNVLIRWDGSVWRAVQGGPQEAAYGGLSVLRGGTDPEGWFGAYGEIYHLVNGEWQWQPLSDYSAARLLVEDIEVPDATEGWAVTEHALYRYDGQSWQKEALPTRADAVFYDVDAPGKGNAWVLVEPDGLFHWTGFAWEFHSLAPMGDAFRPVRLRALQLVPGQPSTDVWLVGKSPSIGRYRVVTPVGTVHLPYLARGHRLSR
jgi:hypothetical protein